MRVRTRLLTLGAAALLAVPSSAVPAPPAGGAPPSVAALDEAMAAYGRWMLQVMEAEAPLQQAFAALGPGFQEARSAGGSQTLAERMRPLIARTLATADAVNARIAAIETPGFPSLDLPPEVRPAAILREMLSVNREIRGVVAGLGALLDANDPEAVQTATVRLMASLRLLFESQILLRRATLAATPRDESSWNLANFDLLYLRVAARIFDAWHPFAPPRVAPELAGDMRALGAELEANAREGEQRIDAELAEYRTWLTAATDGHDPSQASMARRLTAVAQRTRDYIGLSRDVAAIIREAEAEFGRPVGQDQVVGFLRRLQPIRARIESIARQIAAATAAAP